MADNYCLFSEALSIRSPEEKAWLQEQLSTNDNDDYKFLEDYGTDPEERGYRGFEEEFHDAHEGAHDAHLWLYADESGDPDRLVHLVQKFIKKFDPAGCWCFRWAVSCSKPRLGEFGGGAAFVTADKVEWMNTDSFLMDHYEAFYKQQGKAPYAQQTRNA